MTKFFYFDQNNTGGYFDESMGYAVIIEAESAKKANAKLEALGGYFNGCADGVDCPCCGDRWYRVEDRDGKDYPSYYSKVHNPEGAILLKWGMPIYIHYLRGDFTEFRSLEDK